MRRPGPTTTVGTPPRIRRRSGSPGIDVGGHRLHLSCTGSGTPTVVLEPGGGDMSSNLGRIAPAVARDTRVCVYDRAGRGWSEPADASQDGLQIAADLHTLLQRGQVPGPYVLAGHSFGGLYVLTFAARYPDEVAGMVLIDSTAPASTRRRGRHRPATVTPAASWRGPPHWRRPPLDSVWSACTDRSTTAACRRGSGTRYAPALRRRTAPVAPSTSTSGRMPRWCKPPLSPTSSTTPCRPHGRQRTRCSLVGGAARPRHIVDKQRTTRHRRRHPLIADHGRGRLSRHHSSHRRRRLIGPKRRAVRQLIPGTVDDRRLAKRSRRPGSSAYRSSWGQRRRHPW